MLIASGQACQLTEVSIWRDARRACNSQIQPSTQELLTHKVGIGSLFVECKLWAVETLIFWVSQAMLLSGRYSFVNWFIKLSRRSQLPNAGLWKGFCSTFISWFTEWVTPTHHPMLMCFHGGKRAAVKSAAACSTRAAWVFIINTHFLLC